MHINIFTVIGRGGEQITRLQVESGCKIQMAPDSAGQPERVCSLSGSREAITRAKELIMNIVHQRGRSEGIAGLDLGPGLGQGKISNTSLLNSRTKQLLARFVSSHLTGLYPVFHISPEGYNGFSSTPRIPEPDYFQLMCKIFNHRLK